MTVTYSFTLFSSLGALRLIKYYITISYSTLTGLYIWHQLVEWDSVLLWLHHSICLKHCRWVHFAHIYQTFTLIYLLSLETLGSLLELKIKFCGFERFGCIARVCNDWPSGRSVGFKKDKKHNFVCSRDCLQPTRPIWHVNSKATLISWTMTVFQQSLV